MQELTTVEAIEFEQCEEAIQRCADVFDAATQALATIRDKRLYRERYRTFDEYCERRWGYTRQHTNRLIAAAGVMESLRMEPKGSKPPAHEENDPEIPLPENERQARPLTQIEPEQRQEVWREVVRTAPEGGVTAAHVEKVVKQKKAAGSKTKAAEVAAPKANPEVAVEDKKVTVIHSPNLDELRDLAGDLALQAERFRDGAAEIVARLAFNERELAVKLIAEATKEVMEALDRPLAGLKQSASR